MVTFTLHTSKVIISIIAITQSILQSKIVIANKNTYCKI